MKFDLVNEKMVGPIKKLDNEELACGTSDKKIVIWDLKSRSIKYKLEGHLGSVNSLLKLKNDQLEVLKIKL
jgi:hypothetical protein